MVHAWKVIVRDRDGKVVYAPNGKEMKLLVSGKRIEQPDGSVAQFPCEFQTEQDVCDHVRRHYRNFTVLGAYDADKDPPAMLFPVPPQSFQFGILDKVRAELAGEPGPFADRAALPRDVIPRVVIPRTLVKPTPLPRIRR